MKKYFQKGFLPLKFCEEFVDEVFIGLIFFLAHHHLRNHLDSVMVKLISTHSLKAARNMPHVHNRPRRVTVATVTSAGAPSSASSSHSGTPPSCSVNSENPDYYYLINASYYHLTKVLCIIICLVISPHSLASLMILLILEQNKEPKHPLSQNLAGNKK